MEIREAQTLADYAGILAIDEVVWNDTNAPVAMQKWPDAGELKAAMVAEGRRPPHARPARRAGLCRRPVRC